MSSDETSSVSTHQSALADNAYPEPATPGFRKHLENEAPHLLKDFDAIHGQKQELVDELQRRCDSVQAELAELYEIKRLHPDVYAVPGGALSGDSSSKSDGTGSSHDGHAQPAMATKSKTRIALSDSTQSDNHPSSHTGQSTHGRHEPPMATQATQRMVLSDSSASEPNASQSSQDKVQQYMETKRKHKVPVSDSGRSRGRQSDTSSIKAPKVISASEAILAMKVKIRLLKVIQLLNVNGPDKHIPASPAARAKAREIALAAKDFAVDSNASYPLVARCSFYIAHTYYDAENPKDLQQAIVWFERAIEASEADYPEGKWAQDWLDNYENLAMPEARPTSSSSMVGGFVNSVWNTVFGYRRYPTNSSSPTDVEPRPSTLERLASNGSTYSRVFKPQRGGQRIPSFTTANSSEVFSTKSDSPISPNTKLPNTKPPIAVSTRDFAASTPKVKDPSPDSFSARDVVAEYFANRTPADQKSPVDDSPTSDTTQDHYGLKWSQNRLFGKNADFCLSPESTDPIWEEEEEEEQNIPANVHGGFVEASALSPAMQRSPFKHTHENHYETNSPTSPPAIETDWQRRKSSYVPPRILRIANATSPTSSSSPSEPSFPQPNPAPLTHLQTTTSTSPPHLSPPLFPHSRTQSLAEPSISPAYPLSPSYSIRSEPGTGIGLSQRGTGAGKKRNSLSLILRATGLDVPRKRDLAAQMEEGQSPSAPRAEEEGLWRRRGSDFEEEV